MWETDTEFHERNLQYRASWAILIKEGGVNDSAK